MSPDSATKYNRIFIPFFAERNLPPVITVNSWGTTLQTLKPLPVHIDIQALYDPTTYRYQEAQKRTCTLKDLEHEITDWSLQSTVIPGSGFVGCDIFTTIKNPEGEETTTKVACDVQWIRKPPQDPKPSLTFPQKFDTLGIQWIISEHLLRFDTFSPQALEQLFVN